MKILEINSCAICPAKIWVEHKKRVCKNADNRIIESPLNDIPDWCPLPDAQQTDKDGYIAHLKNKIVFLNNLINSLMKRHDKHGTIPVYPEYEQADEAMPPDWAFRCPFCKIKHKTLQETWACCKK